jgi:raffinose/stachyose/melibiose transport system substrate-binding protein
MKNTAKLLCTTAAGGLFALALAGSANAATTISFLVDNGPSVAKAAQALADAFMAKNPDIKIEIEIRSGGSEGDNIVKTRLATGEMADMFNYNSGSLFQALNPKQNLADLSGEPWQANVDDMFKKVVSADGKVYGAPYETAMGGGVFYNKKVYEKLGLQVPKTWAEFMANNAKIKAAGGVAPVIQTYKDGWSSQLFLLGDFHNVMAVDPKFAEEYTANKAKFATHAAAKRGFEYLEEVFKAGYLNADFAAASYDEGLRMVASGEGAHYPMLTFAIGPLIENNLNAAKDVGFFAIPGADAGKNGLSAWMNQGVYVPKTTKHLAEVKKFLAFMVSPEGCDTETKAIGAMGPYLIKGCSLPKDLPASVTDLVAYFDKGAFTPALEFLSPVKGPSLEQITVEVGSGIRPAAEGAALYDQDVRKQAMQLGLPGWK